MPHELQVHTPLNPRLETALMLSLSYRALNNGKQGWMWAALSLGSLLIASSCIAADPPAETSDDGPAPVVGQPTPVQLLEWAHHSNSIYTTGKFNGLGNWQFSIQGGGTLTACTLWQLQHLDHHANSMAVGRKRSTIVLGTNVGVVEVLDGMKLVPRKAFAVGKRYSIYAVAIDSDEQQIAACGTDGTVLVWKIDSEAPLHHLQKTSREGERMASLAFSHDGKSLAALSRYGWLSLWDLTSGQLIGEPVDHAGGENSTLRFTPSGDRIVVVERAAIRFWHPVDEPVVRVVRPPEAVCPRYTPEEESRIGVGPSYGDGIRFAGVSTLSSDATQVASILQNGSVAIWDLKTMKVQMTLPPPSVTKTWEFAGEYPGNYFQSIRISPDGKRVAASAMEELFVWQMLP